MQFKSVVAMIAASAVVAMAFPAALPVEDSAALLEARAEQAAQVNQQAQTNLVQNAMQQIQSGQVQQLTQAQQQQAIQFATQQGAYTQAGQWVNPYNYWGNGFIGQYGYLDYYTQLYLWYLLYAQGGGWNWNQYNYPCYPGYLC